jgi:PAS domain S-box-containing protein
MNSEGTVVNNTSAVTKPKDRGDNSGKEPPDRGKIGEASLIDRERLESFILNSRLPIVTLDEYHHVLACNQDFERLFQYEESEIIGKSLDRLLGGERHLEEARSYTEETLKGKAIHGCGGRLRKDGTYVDVEFFGVPVMVDEKIKGAYGIYIDISEKVQAEEKLKLSEKRYRDLYEGSLDGYAMVNMEGKIMESNSTFRQMIGYGEDELKGLTYEDLTPSRWHPLEADIIKQQVLTRGHSDLYEKEYIRKNGTIFPIEIRTYLLKDERGKPAGMWAFVRDITERKRAQSTLQENEERYRTLFEDAADIIAIINAEGRLLEINERFERESGYLRSEVVGKSIFNSGILTEESAERALHYLTKMLAGEDCPTFEIDGVGKDGKIIPYELRAMPIRKTGEIISIQAILRNISERKHSEALLRESEQRYRSLFDSINDFIFNHDLEGRFLTMNYAAAQTLGYMPEEMIGRPISDFMLPEYRKAFREDYLVQIAEKGSFEGVSVYLDSKGAAHYIEYRTTLVKEKGKAPYVSGVGRDISERVEAQKEMKELERQVQHAQRMEAVGTLAGGIAHNFNNLLMGIQGYVSLMLFDTNPDHPHHEKLKRIEKIVKSGSKLSDQLLGYAREGKYEIKPISLNQIVQEISETFETTRKEIRVLRELAEDLLGIKADRGQIEQVLLNLFVNAADAMPGGGSLHLKTCNVTHKALEGKPYKVKPGNYVMLMVRDTGKGMEKETMEHIFEPFFTTKGLANGTGLGLASVYGIVKGHGGFIEVESEKGQGTAFFIYLPASNEIAAGVVKSDDRFLTGSETILLVDDEDMVLDAGGKMLQALGYSVIAAKSGPEATEIYQKYEDTIHMVILDMIMPQMGGGETYDRLKEQDPEVKVLLSSGYSLDGQAHEILDRGCDGFIQKPFDLRHLSRKLREILDA